MDRHLLRTLRALDLQQGRTDHDVARATGMLTVDACEALDALVSADLVRRRTLSPPVYLLKPAGRQRLQQLQRQPRTTEARA